MRAASRYQRHGEHHQTARFGWLRAAVLGANDGIVSTASLVLGVAAANGSHQSVMIAGFAGLVAGAMAELDRERQELKDDAEAEHRELAGIYVKRGLDKELARQVADQLMAHDALGAHARDELGITRQLRAQPVPAAIASAASFATGAALPLAAVLLTPHGVSIPWVGASSLVFLAILGAVAARAGGAPLAPAVLRATFWGAAAMAVTAGVGMLFGATP